MGSQASCCADLYENHPEPERCVPSSPPGSRAGSQLESQQGHSHQLRFKTSQGGFQALAGSTIASSSSSSMAPTHMVQEAYKMPTLSSFVHCEQNDDDDNDVTFASAADTESEDEDDDDEEEKKKRYFERTDLLDVLPLHPTLFSRRHAVSNEATGMYNPRRAGHMPPIFEKSQAQERALRKAVDACPFFKGLDAPRVSRLVSSMPVREVPAGEKIIEQGRTEDTAYALLFGECVVVDETATQQLYNPQDSASSAFFAFEHIGSLRASLADKVKERSNNVGKMESGRRFFGELAMLWGSPRTVSLYTTKHSMVAELRREDYIKLVVQTEIEVRNRKIECLRKVKLLETFSDEDIAKLCDVSDVQIFEEGETVIKQGDWGNDVFVVKTGELLARDGSKGRRSGQVEGAGYGPGDLVGERALVQKTIRDQTVIALCRSELIIISRGKFHRLLGRLDEIGNKHYLLDPRKSIADFYRRGDTFGPAGSAKYCGPAIQAERAKQQRSELGESEWFAVYRPTSKDAISKLMSGRAVGKGLNVKGKSAKCGCLSGFVPFLQIHDNDHKDKVQAPPQNSRIQVFYQNHDARAEALSVFQAAAAPLNEDRAEKTPISACPSPKTKDRQEIFEIIEITTYTTVFGLEVPESVLCDIYIQRPDLSFLAGWETGRTSEPAFMDMNLQSLREDSDPKVVLFQADSANPMNPQGLVLAYAESTVKPLVSDFDTFLVGSRGVIYDELPADQIAIASWSLDSTLKILQNPEQSSWTTRWLEILSEENFHPDIPKYGFGDGASYRLITEVVSATIACGAIRHGAECFNYYFPQEPDEEYLVVSDAFPNKPWTYMKQVELRTYLYERIVEGFSFPLNPVWLVRDPEWYKVFEAMQNDEEVAINLSKWMPKSSGLMEKVQAIHFEFPDGFQQEFTVADADLQIDDNTALLRARTRAMSLKTISNFGASVIGAYADECDFVDEGPDPLKSRRTF